jgi:hypothetical protein
VSAAGGNEGLWRSGSRPRPGPSGWNAQVVSQKQLEMTADTMGHSLVYWVQDCLKAGLFE